MGCMLVLRVGRAFAVLACGYRLLWGKAQVGGAGQGSECCSPPLGRGRCSG